MNIFQKMKIIFKVKKPVSNIVKEVSNMKKGYKTTEFWLTVISNLITVVGALQGVIDPKTASICLAILNGVYTFVRGLLKASAEAPTETSKPS